MRLGVALIGLAAILTAGPAAAKNPPEPVAFLPFIKADRDTDRGFPRLDSVVTITMAQDLGASRKIDLLDYRSTYTAVAAVLYPEDRPFGYRRADSVAGFISNWAAISRDGARR